ncbi:MAG: hypothetical protein ALMCE001_12690 [Methanocorpusculum sp. MCE]|nr:MAG: hypothetical protein ALMCE001_12690 [Methanocorpusculum sp. MCE]
MLCTIQNTFLISFDIHFTKCRTFFSSKILIKGNCIFIGDI